MLKYYLRNGKLKEKKYSQKLESRGDKKQDFSQLTYEDCTPVQGFITNFTELSPQKPTVAQPLKELLSFYGNQRFITVIIRARHWSLSSPQPSGLFL
jgi:hypothetical protein